MPRLPAVPLMVHDPYFSVWMPDDSLTNTDTAHWCGSELPVHILFSVDGITYRLLGKGEAPYLAFTGMELTPLSTRYRFETACVRLTLSFTSPLLPDDLDRASTPISLIRAEACSLDGMAHEVALTLDASDRFCWRGDEKPEIGAYPMPYPELGMMSISQLSQKLLCHSGDGVTIDWGYLYLGAPGGKLAYDGERLRCEVHGTAGDTNAVFKLLMGYDDVASILYYGNPRKAWYARNGKDFASAMLETLARFDDLLAACSAWDERLLNEAQKIGGDDYALIVSASWRHVWAAHKLFADENGQMCFISKENNSNGCAGTVDVSYPSTPLFLKFCPELVSAMCRPVLRFARMPVWTYDFAPHDVGRYPIVNGQVYGCDGTLSVGRRPLHQPPFYLMPAQPPRYNLRGQMPVEESANMIIMLYAASYFGADGDLAKQNRETLEKWVRYLVEYGEDPGEQLCTDDFAGHLAHNVNLAAKAMVGVMCYGRMLESWGEDGSFYLNRAREMADSWLKRCCVGEGTPLTFDGRGWSMKYNLAWDRALNLGLFDRDFYLSEARSYIKHMNDFGLPLDNRKTYTKSDWELWTAAMSPDEEVRGAIISRVARYLRETPDRVAFSDWYDTVTGKHEQFIARSVQGGLYMPFICSWED
ncbi:MAG: DUF4965 domain-containing protein [Clostridiales bacterium]|nr:DUF4965 domain-containing protein [Clostridiales bacterium]